MDEQDIHDRINALVEREHALRAALADGRLSAQEEHAELKDAEQKLDQLWDLLRQREAKRNAGLDPDEAGERPVSEVEGYRQ
ncbi:DUF2630 family protein [Kineococcus indalonis]|uniref:DUF2630 family protein n=1 Tax=Kineococcus indalonis TaxID=2696566 RepID=UPI001412D1A4|nr:DUF2630 family protein [Kineococcus indalonis]NAZ86999.1 DUF2630 family protein [Kineococcus indalonis]